MKPAGARTALGVALAVLSAVLLTLAFPPYNCGLLILIAFVPMLVSLHRLMPRSISSLASAIAIGGWLGAFLVPIFGGKSFVVSAAIPLAFGALAFAMDRSKRAFHEQTGYRWFVLEGVAGWVGFELIRSLIPAIGTWGFVGYPLWEHPWLLQPVSIVGVYGLDLLIMLCNFVVAQAVLAAIDRRVAGTVGVADRAGQPDTVGIAVGAGRPDTVGVAETGATRLAGRGDVATGARDPRCMPRVTLVGSRRALRWLAVGVVLLVGWVGLSWGMYVARPAEPGTLTVAAVQPNLPRAAHRDTATTSEERVAVLAAQTREAAADGAQLVVWPEMVLGFDPQVEHTGELTSLASETGAYIVAGYVVDDGQGFRNEATVLTPEGEFLGVYGKRHPMITSGEPRTVSAGTYPVYDTPVGRLATMICFDAHFTDVSRRLAREGAQLVAVPSLFGPPLAKLPYTQLVFRAVENRTVMVMADVAYNSAVVDPYGHVCKLSMTPEGAQETLVSDVALAQAAPLYTRFGDWLGWVSLAAMVGFMVYMPVRMRRGTARRAADLAATDETRGSTV